jgi:hypothetical protein
MFENILIPSSIVSTILIVWFKTEAFIEYGQLLRLTKVFFIEDFKNEQKNNPGLDFLLFLSIRKNCFFTRLITCPLCFGFWLSLISSYFFKIESFCAVYVFSLILYFSIIKIMHENV